MPEGGKGGRWESGRVSGGRQGQDTSRPRGSKGVWRSYAEGLPRRGTSEERRLSRCMRERVCSRGFLPHRHGPLARTFRGLPDRSRPLNRRGSSRFQFNIFPHHSIPAVCPNSVVRTTSICTGLIAGVSPPPRIATQLERLFGRLGRKRFRVGSYANRRNADFGLPQAMVGRADRRTAKPLGRCDPLG